MHQRYQYPFKPLAKQPNFMGLTGPLRLHFLLSALGKVALQKEQMIYIY
jgi:hypothetical protein